MKNEKDAYEFYKKNKKSLLFTCSKIPTKKMNYTRYEFYQNNKILRITSDPPELHYCFYEPKSDETHDTMNFHQNTRNGNLTLYNANININHIFHHKNAYDLYKLIGSITKFYHEKIKILKILKVRAYNLSMTHSEGSLKLIHYNHPESTILHSKNYKTSNLKDLYQRKKTQHDSFNDLKKINHPDYRSWTSIDHYLFQITPQMCSHIHKDLTEFFNKTSLLNQ